jgi:hypothetical protein
LALDFEERQRSAGFDVAVKRHSGPVLPDASPDKFLICLFIKSFPLLARVLLMAGRVQVRPQPHQSVSTQF